MKQDLDNIKLDNLKLEKVKKEIEDLENELKYHAKLYYEQDTNEISDYEYDKLNSKLKKLLQEYPQFKKEDSITNKVGGEVKKGFSKVEHKVPLQSLMDVFNYDEVKEFYDKIQKEAVINHIDDLKFVVETKIDGLSAALEYEKGLFKRRSTRGNGLVGEDVTNNIKTIKTIPTKINHDSNLVVRGEVFISKADFENLNNIRRQNNEELFANARNAASGSLRQLESKDVEKRGLDMYIFNVQSDDENKFNSHFEYLEYLKKLGFNVIPYKYLCRSYDQIIDAIENIHKLRNDLGFGIDGAVIKVDNLRFRKILGQTAKTPRWAIAYKYPPEAKETKVLDVVFTVGKTGIITPNAILEPVLVDGSTISKVSLHNENILRQKDVKVGDSVLVHKAGDVIPEIAKVLKEKRDGSEKDVIIPKHCPACGSEVLREDNKKAIKCPSLECPAKLQKSLEHFASREAMNIEGLGEGIIVQLLEKKLIKNISDIYNLTLEDISSLKKSTSTKFAPKLYDAIEKSKSNDLYRLLNALSIPNVGSAMAKVLAQKFKSMNNLENATIDELSQIDGIGEIASKQIYDFFHLDQNIDLINKLKKDGLNMNAIEKQNTADTLSGLTFVITGTFEDLKRGEITNLITSNGGKVSSSVSSKTSYLLAGSDAGSKLDKAKKLGIKIIDINQLKELINKN